MYNVLLSLLPSICLPLAATELASEAVYGFSRLESLGDSSWEWWAGLGALVLLLAYVWLVYRREARTVTMSRAVVLALLRTTAIAGLVAFFLGLERRTSTLVVEPSRVVVLVDTSLSMSLPSDDPTAGDGAVSRAAAAQQLLADSRLIEDLRTEHDVDLVAFGDATRPVTYLQQHQDAEGEQPSPDVGENEERLGQARIARDFDAYGHETRLGDAIATTLERYRGLPLAGIVVLTDGGQNRGLELPAAADAAAAVRAKIHSIGFGPTTAPANVDIRELIAPERAYPGDKFTLQAIVHAQDLAGQKVELQLSRRPAGDSDAPEAWELLETRAVSASADDTLETVRFETNPGEVGEYTYEVRAIPSRREVLNDDNSQRAQVAVIDRKTNVLLYAGGPTRDYRFVRNQLRRDQSFVVDVLLGTAAPGISQDANEILNEFPATAEQLSKYDAIVAFDPDWSALSADKVRLVEAWVARQAGGLVVVPGRVNTPRWSIDARMRTIRGLYPVRLPNQLLDRRSDADDLDVVSRIDVTPEGRDAEFLWLTDNREENLEVWDSFDGVYAVLKHQGPKAGATIYARLAGNADDKNGLEYIVGHYYGAGQVLLIGSGELWRLRKLGAEYYERIWTSLLRHTSQARLLQGSPRGKLLVAQDRYEVGATVPVRAVMLDQQMEPLVADSLPLELEMPGGRSSQLVLTADTSRVGTFAGEFRVLAPGAYHMTLQVPDSSDQLSRNLRVTTPQLEAGQTTRNSEALEALAAATGGHYFSMPSDAVTGSDSRPSILAATPSQSRSKRVIGAVDRAFDRHQSLVLLALVAGALSLEWIVRRLNYLA